MRKLEVLFVGFLLLISTSVLQAQYSQQRLNQLDAYLSKSQQQWQVPGLAVGIIQGDRLIFAKGYGLRNITQQETVDARTVFPVASNTKSFTAVALAMLVDEEKLTWDTKVVDVYPQFSLYDEYVTQNFTIADMLSHRSGLVTFSGDLLWYGSDYSREEVVAKLPYLKAEHDFRTDFGYSNILYILAGEIIEEVSGESYDDFIRKRIFKPLGMKNSYMSVEEIKDLDNVITPHNKVNDSVFPIEFINWDNIGAAGVINSNVEDMAQWIRLNLEQGQWKGKELVSKQQYEEMWTPHTNFKVGERYRRNWPSMHFRSYGLGWSLNDYQGRKIVSHSGGYDGVITYTCLVPEEDLGFVILTNSNNSLYNALSYKILDYFLSGDTTDWSALYLPYQQKGDQRELVAAKKNAAKPSLELNQYAGEYSDKMYGKAVVEVKGNEMSVKLAHTKIWEGNFTPFDADTFLLEFDQVPSLPQGYIQFVVENGKVKSFTIDVPNPDFDFTEFTFEKVQ